MVSESDLLTRLREILSASDLDTATAGSVRRELEKHFGVDLSDRKTFIRDQIDAYLESQVANPQEDEEEAAPEEEVGEASENADQNDDVKVEQNDDVEVEEEEVVKTRRKKAPKKVDNGGSKRGGFKTVYSLSPQLQVIVGEPEMARTEVVKKIWAYIREKDLQDPKNRRIIRCECDESLHAVFRVNSIDMFKMNKALSKHIWPLNREDEPVKKMKKEEDSDHCISEGEASNGEEQEVEEEVVKKERGSNRKKTKKRSRSAKVDKEVKKRGGGFTKLSSLSPELQKVTGASELARTEVVKKLWEYIRQNNMQDPKNKRTIICDELFRTLFDVDSIDMFQMNKALSKHILPLNREAALDNATQTERQSEHEQEDEADHEEKRLKKGD